MKRIVLVLAALAMCGCVQGPNYKRPQVALPGGFRGAPAPGIFGLLRSARFVLLVLSSPADPAMAGPGSILQEAAAGYRDRLDVVTAELAGDHPDWAGFAALLIRPDGYVAWSLRRDTPAPVAPPLAAWLGDPRGKITAAVRAAQSERQPS